MNKSFFILYMLAVPVILLGQKNVIPAIQTQMLGIQLPEGSKQDKRLLSVAAAGSFLSTSSEYKNLEFTPVEVYSIPIASGFNIEIVRTNLLANGYNVKFDNGDNKLLWFSRNNNNWLVYLSQEANETNIYIGKATGKFPADFDNSGSPLIPGTSTAIGNLQKTVNPDNGSAIIPPAKQENKPVQSSSSNGNFQYSTSNFDDGWVSTIQKDWVLVEKGNARVYLFYAVPYNADNFSGTGVMDRDYYWDNYISGQFQTAAKQYNDAGEFVSSLKPKYVEGRGTDPVTGSPVFVAMALSVAPNSARMTVAAYPDEASFRQAFPKSNDNFTSDLTSMSRYNKFAIGANDFVGTWQNGNTSTLQWAYETPSGYEGYAGMTVAATSDEFTFNADNTYSSIHNGATGAVGAMSTYQQNYKGTSTVSNWNMVLTNRWQGQTYNFDAYYEAIKGGRLLYLNDNGGSKFQLVKVK